MRIADHLHGDAYKPKVWPAGCLIQWGEDLRGTFFFFEAFLAEGGFFRGEGPTLPDAERACKVRYRAYADCPGHAWDRRGREDGGAYCVHCKFFGAGVLDPLTMCCQCNTPAWWTTDNQDRMWCKACARNMPEDLMTELHWEMRDFSAKRAEEHRENVAAGRDFACAQCGSQVDYGAGNGMAICRVCDAKHFKTRVAAITYASIFGGNPAAFHLFKESPS